MVPAYTKCDVQLIKVAPDDGLIQSETCRASNGEYSLITRILRHLVGLYTYCRMIHGAYSVKCHSNLACNVISVTVCVFFLVDDVSDLVLRIFFKFS